MKKQKHKVDLTPEERQTLQTLVRKGHHSALKLMRAHILLKADSHGPGWTDAQIADAFGCHEQNRLQCSQTFCGARETINFGAQAPKSTVSRAET